MALYPHAKSERTAGLAVGPTGFFVFQKRDRTEAQLAEIVKFLLYINGEKWLRDGCINSGQLPARRSVGAPLAGDAAYEQALRWVQTYGVSSMGLECRGAGQVRSAMPAFLQAMFLKKMTPQEAAEGMVKKAAEIMQK
jgi:hypothetical protein